MMKVKDFCCLLAGILLLALAFLINGYLEDTAPLANKGYAQETAVSQRYEEPPVKEPLPRHVRAF